MIVVIEGVNGSGKTTTACALAEATGWPLYRPFRRGYSSHMAEEVAIMARLGISINSYHEELYLADVYRVLRPNLITDRNLPSGIVYPMARGEWTHSPDVTRDIIARWEADMREAGVLYVYLSSPDAFQRRSHNLEGFTLAQHSALDALYQKYFVQCALPKAHINTGVFTPAQVVARIMERITPP